MIYCTDPTLIYTLIIIKKIFLLITIIAPILLIVTLTIRLMDMVRNPEEKKNIKKIKNALIATAILFFIPTLVNIISLIIGSNTSFTSCWNSIKPSTNMQTSLYMDDGEQSLEENTTFLTDSSEYEKGKQTEKSKEKPNTPYNGSTTNITSSKKEAFLSSLEQMSKQVEEDYKNGIIWKYQNSNTRNSFEIARSSSRVCNCALLAVWGYVDIGLIDPGDRFYNKYENGKNSIAWKNSVRDKILSQATLIDGNGQIAKKMAQDGTLQPGDIIFWQNAGHTNIYAGDNQFYEAGRVGNNGKGNMDNYTFTTFGPVGDGYINSRVWKILRLN